MTAAVERYAAIVTLPTTLTVDHYTVQVSRDGTSWIALLGDSQTAAQELAANTDPAGTPEFSVSDAGFADPVHGQCKPNDDSDDTSQSISVADFTNTEHIALGAP